MILYGRVKHVLYIGDIEIEKFIVGHSRFKSKKLIVFHVSIKFIKNIKKISNNRRNI